MSAFDPVLTDSGTLGNAITQELVNNFIVSYIQMANVEQFANMQFSFKAQSIQFTRFNQMPVSTATLAENLEIPAVAMSDSLITFTPEEYGNAISLTRKSDIVTGGRNSMGAMRVLGDNLAVTNDQLAINSLNTSTNLLFGGAATSTATVLNADTMNRVELERLYHQLRLANVPFHPATPGLYVLLCHDAVASSLRSDVTSGSWTDIVKQSPSVGAVLNNMIGVYAGFAIVVNNRLPVQVGAGSDSQNVYTSIVMGEDALGKATSIQPEIDVSDLASKNNRIKSISWYEMIQYGPIRPESVYKMETSGV